MDRPVGRITYTQMLNRRGGIECDFTVTRLGADRFFIVTGTAFGNHDLGWIRSHAPDDGSVTLTDVTSARACLGIWGPRAREIVASTSTDDWSNDAFPYLSARQVSVGPVPVLALRVTYVGELGWELYAPMEYGVVLWDTLWAAGKPHGHGGRGLSGHRGLRLEKGYRVWSSDITPDDTPGPGGAGVCGAAWASRSRSSVATRSKPPGRAARIGACAAWSSTSRWPWRWATSRSGSGSRSWDGSRPAGTGTRSGPASPTATCPAAQAEVDQRVEVEIFGEWVGGTVSAEPLFDPRGERIRA